MLGELVQPGRRHRCECCLEVFLCHLCEIAYTHSLHEAAHIEHGEKQFVCRRCAEEKKYHYALIGHESSHWSLYNYITGRMVWKRYLSWRRDRIARWHESEPEYGVRR